MADDLTSAIETNAEGPRRASGDTGSAEQHSLTDQIAADKYLAAKVANKRSGLPIRHFKLRPPGAADVDLGQR